MILKGIFLFIWLSLSTMWSSYNGLDHGIYISVFDIQHDPISGKGEVVIKSFSDDLTNALRSMNFNIPADAEPCDQKDAFMDYVSEHLSIVMNGQSLKLGYEVCSIENNTHWIVLTFHADAQLSNIEVKTDWMTELFSNQQNIIKVQSGEKRLSDRLSLEKKVSKLAF